MVSTPMKVPTLPSLLIDRLPGRFASLSFAILAGAVSCADRDGLLVSTAGVVAMRQEHSLPASAELRLDAANETVRFLRGKDLAASLEGDHAYARSREAGHYAEMAIAFIEAHRSTFRLEEPTAELSEKRVSSDAEGMTHVRLAQSYRGIPVFGAELLVHFRSADGIYLVNGEYLPTPTGLETRPSLSTDDALHFVATQHPELDGGCSGCESELVVFGRDRAEPRLAYRVRVSVSLTEGWDYFIDAQNGTVLLRIPTVYSATSQ